MTRLAILIVLIYRNLFRQFMLPSCRFVPTCSEYARQALLRHGWFRGGRKILARICRCHPFHPGGFDPVSL